jgi:hypothetical protein
MITIKLVLDRVDIHLHDETKAGGYSDLCLKLNAIAESQQEIKELIMATAAEFTAGFAKLDAATSAIAARIQKYIDAVQTGNMTDAEEAAALATLGGAVTALEAMGKDPVNPVPVPVPL